MDDSVVNENIELDCYPYSFSPLLLFTSSGYFDKGYSNYNAVARFFEPVLRPLGIDMLENVLCDRKNMYYDELFLYVQENKMFVPCCIDAHFTAFQVVGKNALLYYDPTSSDVKLVRGEHAFTTFMGFLLIKCNLGNSQHMVDKKSYYTGNESNSLRRNLYNLWKDINTTELSRIVYSVRMRSIPLDLNTWMLINGRANVKSMSTQLTGNTCYFQTYLYGILCVVGKPQLANNYELVTFPGVQLLAKATVAVSRFLMEFFVAEETKQLPNGEERNFKVMRPLTNSNFILDFHRYSKSPYFGLITRYMKHLHFPVPEYTQQYSETINYFKRKKTLHYYDKFTLAGAMSSTLNTKSLQRVRTTDDAAYKLAGSSYYKYRAVNLMFGFNVGIIMRLNSFCRFNSLRKNQLLAFYKVLQPLIGGCVSNEINAMTSEMDDPNADKYRDYYYMAQFEVGQQELIDAHHYSYLIDMCAISETKSPGRSKSKYRPLVEKVNQILSEHILYSTQEPYDYDKLLSKDDFKIAYLPYFQRMFMSTEYLKSFVGLGFAEVNAGEKEVNSLTQTVFYKSRLMSQKAHQMEYEFAKECINQMARSNLRRYLNKFDGHQSSTKDYSVSIKIGYGHTYSKYNTLMHFLNVVECYWQNPDLNNIQVFGKDIRRLLAVSCQKIFFKKDAARGYYHYGVLETDAKHYRYSNMDLAVASTVGYVNPSISRADHYAKTNNLVLTDRVYEYHYLKSILEGLFSRANGCRIKSDNVVLNLCLLSLMLDFGLYEEHGSLLNLPYLKSLQHRNDKLQLQVEVANMIHEYDRKNTSDTVTRIKVEDLLFEVSYKFLVNKDFDLGSKQNELIQQLNADPSYQQHLLLCKCNLSLCQINKSVEVDYYKLKCNGDFRTVIPRNFSKSTGEYLEKITKQYTFSESDQVIVYDNLPLFDLRIPQPEIKLYKVRFDAPTKIQSMVKYVEIKNAFCTMQNDHYAAEKESGAHGKHEQCLVFIADNTLLIESSHENSLTIRINKIPLEIATLYFNKSFSFVPCFKYEDSEDVIIFTSPNIKYLVDNGGQFASDYYGMRHELMECIESVEVFVDLNDNHAFKKSQLNTLITESKIVIYFPDFLLQVTSRQDLINLLDYAINIRNVSLYILVLLYLIRCSINLTFNHEERKIKKITGPWLEASKYALQKIDDSQYNSIFEKQFFDLNQYHDVPLDDFVEILCENFAKYQRYTEDGQYQIIPRKKQKDFLKRIIRSEECFHFSEVGSGKTKVILPLLCQLFLSNNKEAHACLRRGGSMKRTLVVIVPQHLVGDATLQVLRYCLNLNFLEDYRVYDDIFALLHENCHFDDERKKIFVTSFNQFKKALTYDIIHSKIWPERKRFLVLIDEVDDFLDRDKLVFNICSNKGNNFDRTTLDFYYEVSRSAYSSNGCPQIIQNSPNPEYWMNLYEKFCAIHEEIQDTSKSINKSFGIFNEETLRHCSTNIAHDIEGYKSLIARPYESVNRAMPGSYYSDVERTIYLTFVILTEDIAKYDDLFQQERKFISFEYWSSYINQLDYDDLVYGHDTLSECVKKFPEIMDGLVRFLYEIILRRMEIRDKSRSVNSIDVIFNFDCLGFTGTPFIDNYPTFSYLRDQRNDRIPTLIDRSFYAYGSEDLPIQAFRQRFSRFQGVSNNVIVEYVSSDFLQTFRGDEMKILKKVFQREQLQGLSHGDDSMVCNVVVDLCGVFKRSSIHDVRDLVQNFFGPDRFHYVYHIAPADSSDRVLCINSDYDVRFDEEFFKFLVKTYGVSLREKVFFFVDNRNVIGKDIPFQLVFQKLFGVPMFIKSAVIAHDVQDFSKIWQAMGRSRTMNDTRFSIYTSCVSSNHANSTSYSGASQLQDIKEQELTRTLYVQNCDKKLAGNLSSIYQTIIALRNVSMQKFYHSDEIVNVFMEKMNNTIADKVAEHRGKLRQSVLHRDLTARIFKHILKSKFERSMVKSVAEQQLKDNWIDELLGHIIEQKFEQRSQSHDVFDDCIRQLSGEQDKLMEISYSKQQQKQKQKQRNRNHDSDMMDIFDQRHKVHLQWKTDNYFNYALNGLDAPRMMLSLPISIPILTIQYASTSSSTPNIVNVYPTVQFLYSHHIYAEYITKDVREYLDLTGRTEQKFDMFAKSVIHNSMDNEIITAVNENSSGSGGDDRSGVGFGLDFGSKSKDDNSGMNDRSDPMVQLEMKVTRCLVRQNPQYTIAALKQGAYIIGMKDQFNKYDVSHHPLRDHIEYIIDDMGFVLYRKSSDGSVESGNVDTFGPYFVEQYMIMEVLSKQEVAHNVLEYYVRHKAKLESCLRAYNGAQGEGFVCWRFLMAGEAMKASRSIKEKESQAQMEE